MFQNKDGKGIELYKRLFLDSSLCERKTWFLKDGYSEKCAVLQRIQMVCSTTGTDLTAHISTLTVWSAWYEEEYLQYWGLLHYKFNLG